MIAGTIAQVGGIGRNCYTAYTMANIASLLKQEIQRVSRRQIRGETQAVRRATAQYRRDIASLKRHIASLQKTVAFLAAQEKKRVALTPVVAEPAEKIRFRIDGLRSHRARLGLSAEEYGKLAGVSGQTVYLWEQGKTRPRREQLAKVVALRGLGKREALQRLEMLGAAPAKGARRRRAGGPTAEQFIAELVKSGKATTGQINAAWSADGRPGRADNTLSALVRTGKLKRVKLKDARGSRYSVK